MRILFSFNGPHFEPAPSLILQDMQCVQQGTSGTSKPTADVRICDSRESSNDGTWDIAGHDGRSGPVENDLLNAATQTDVQLRSASADLGLDVQDELGAVTLGQADECAAIMGCYGVLPRREAELKAGLVQCEDCIHFDFLGSIVSQSCMIGAANPHKRYPTGKLQDVVALCASKQPMNMEEDWLGGAA